MNISKELEKIGIFPSVQLNIEEKNKIARSITDKLTRNIKELADDYNELYMRLYNCNMFYAQIASKFRGVFYYYKNNTIYIDKNMPNIDLYLMHEAIHYLQNFSRINKQDNRAGLCQFLDFKIFGLGINEAIVQYIAAKAEGNKIHRISNENVTICTNSENYYKYMTSLANQVLLIMGEKVAIKSCVSSTENFETELYNTFEDNTEKILKGFDFILNENNKEYRDENKIIEMYMQTQETIYKTYFSKIIKRLTTTIEVDEQVKKLEEYKQIVGKRLNVPINEDEFEIFKKQIEGQFFKKYVDVNKKQSQNSLMVVYKNFIYNFFNKIGEFIQNKIIKVNK